MAADLDVDATAAAAASGLVTTGALVVAADLVDRVEPLAAEVVEATLAGIVASTAAQQRYELTGCGEMRRSGSSVARSVSSRFPRVGRSDLPIQPSPSSKSRVIPETICKSNPQIDHEVHTAASLDLGLPDASMLSNPGHQI